MGDRPSRAESQPGADEPGARSAPQPDAVASELPDPLPDRTTVLVIGGGATGVSVARDLAMRGLDVTLAERGRLCGETSGHTHGVLHSGARYARNDPAGARACSAENAVLREIAPGCVLETGGLFCRLPGDGAGALDAIADACATVGIETAAVDPRDLESIEALAADCDGALRVPDAVLSPGRLVAATAAGARARGARLCPSAPVTDLHVRAGRVVAATIDGSRVRVEHVVNAAGPWAGAAASLAGCSLPMRPTRGTMVVVDRPGVPLRRVLNRAREPSDGDIVVPRPDGLVLGTTSVPVEGGPDELAEPARVDGADPVRPATVDPAEVTTVRRECARLVPGVDVGEVRAVYWGVRPLVDMSALEKTGGLVALDASPDGPTATQDDGGGRAPDERRAISRAFAVIDHRERAGVAGFTTVVGGKLTTARLMAAAAGDHVADRLGVDREADTASVELPAQDDPEALDALLAAFGGPAPADPPAVGAFPSDRSGPDS